MKRINEYLSTTTGDNAKVTLEPWADFLKITDNEIIYLKADQVKKDILDNCGAYGSSVVKDDGIYVCIR